MKKKIKNWLDSAQYDLETAEYMLMTKRYLYTVFMCHLALEKVLKAKVQEITGKIPPKTHDLISLLELSKLHLHEEMVEFIAEISNLSVLTRYPEDFHKMVKAFTRKRVEGYLVKTKEVFEWIRKFVLL